MEFIKTSLPDVILIKPKILSDSRGVFFEGYKKSLFVANGITENFVQDNYSISSFGVLRGLHYQSHPYPQSKLIRCITGCVFDVAVDIRPNSPTFGHWVGYELSEANKYMLYIPVGFAHGFLALTDNAMLSYKVRQEYSKECDCGVRFDDPDINITWPKISVDYIVSDKDMIQPSLRGSKHRDNLPV